MTTGMWKRTTVLVGLLALVLSGCADRPSSDVLADSILEAGDTQSISLSADQAECIAEILLDSDLSDVTVNGLVEDFDQPEVAAADADSAEAMVADAAVRCAGS